MKSELNRHISEFNRMCDFTIEYCVKRPSFPIDVPEEIMQHEFETGSFTEEYCDKCFKKILEVTGDDVVIKSWSLTGRMNGWFALLCSEQGNELCDEDAYTSDTLEKFSKEIILPLIDDIVEEFYKGYGLALFDFYLGKQNMFLMEFKYETCVSHDFGSEHISCSEVITHSTKYLIDNLSEDQLDQETDIYDEYNNIVEDIEYVSDFLNHVTYLPITLEELNTLKKFNKYIQYEDSDIRETLKLVGIEIGNND